jgi:RNA polymerase sigma factor (sigma-70 family)
MATAQLSHVLQHLRRIHLLGPDPNLNDGELLERFFQHGDQTAFEVLVQRYGSMVLGVCQRILRNTHDTEDAFQAVFLVLANKGRSLLGRQTIGNWLYGVAYHTALKARVTSVQRRSKESQVPVKPSTQPAHEDAWHELRPLLDEELNRLQGKFREAVVLCDVLGKSRKEAALELGIAEGTLSSRLATARRKLAERLKYRGVTLSSAALAVILVQKATAACVAPQLVACTVEAASAVATGAALTGGIVSPSVASLVQGVLNTMFITRCTTTVGLILGFVLLMAGAAGLPFITAAQQDNQPRAGEKKTGQPPGQPGDKKGAKQAADQPKKEDPKKDEKKKNEPKKDEPKKDDDVRVLENIGGIDQVTLEGKAKKLLIKSIGAGAKVDCGNLDVEEIEIETLSGVAQVALKLPDKARLKKLTIGKLEGGAKLDCSQLDVAAITIGNVSGVAQPTLQSTGDITIKSVAAGAKVTVTRCRNLTVDTVAGVPQLTLQSTEDITIKTVTGGKVTVTACRNITVDAVRGPIASITASYSGEAKVQDKSQSEFVKAKINLKKIDR